MTQEEKDLLLKYLCMALPYRVVIEYNNDGFVETRELGLGSLHDFMFDNAETKPYLRPMSSMTDEERKEYKRFVAFSGSPGGAAIFIDWLNANHFDYLNLMENGLAIEVTKENNPYKE